MLRMSTSPISDELANSVYDILVAECGAYDGDEHTRADFVHWLTRAGYYGNEFRIAGKLGFGGKFWFFPDSHREVMTVSAYKEDETGQRPAIIKRANAKLAALAREHGLQNR